MQSDAVQTPDATAAPAPVTPEPLPAAVRGGDIRFADMHYARPDIDVIDGAIAKLKKAIAGGDAPDALMDAYAEVKALYDSADSNMALAYLLYALDVTVPDYEEEYAYLQSELLRIDLDLTDVSILLYESSDETREQMENVYGRGYMDTVYAGKSLNSLEVQPLLRDEQALITEYDRLLATFTLKDGGKEWTLDEMLSDDSLSVEELYRLYDAYYAAFNAKAGELFVELVGIRSDIAKKLGYGSYAAYRYDCYGRDYTVTDAKALQSAVKKHIVPLYLTANGYRAEGTAEAAFAQNEAATANSNFFSDFEGVLSALLSQQAQLGSADAVDLVALSKATFDQAAFFKNLSASAKDFSSSLDESLQFLLRNELYDFSVNPNKMSGSFTTYLPQYSAPYIFTQWDNSATSVSTVIHEFGHFTNYYFNAQTGWSSGDSLDLAEIDSQALQLLMTPYYETLYGTDYAASAEYSLLLDCMYSLVTGCMEDEFQQAVYARPTMALDEMNGLYLRLAKEYGLYALYGYTGTEWARVPHTFQTPMYYISYAVSMVPALELWQIGHADSVGARTAYLKILDRTPYADFRTVLADNGLSDVFDEATIAGIAKMLSTAL